MDYLYSTAAGTDTWTSPFDKENTEADADRDIRRAKPVPQLSFSKRPVWQRFEYDWLGNLSESDDDAHGIYDRSLGTQEHKNTGKPYQLTRGSNATQAASGGFSGNVTAVYDAAGNMTRLSIVRPNTTGACVPSGVGCTQYYAYNWDEVGRLVRAQRWDSTSQSQLATDPVPTATASFELRYRYDASDQRVIKRLYRSSMASQRQSLYLFGSLEVHRTAYSGSTYTIDDRTFVPYAMANGVRLARLHYETATTVPQVAGTGLTDALGKTNTAATLHVLLELGGHLGSTGTVLDKVSSELVERTGYLPFGARENDYRPSRWNGFREDYGFTGKEEDVQVGLVYFGKRYLSPQLGRWLSADPLAIHAPGRADFNLYAYVSGAVLKSVDPVGLDDAEQNRINDILDGDLEKSSVPQVQALAEDKDRAAASLKSWAAPAPTEQESKAIKAYFADAHAQDAEMASRGKYTQLPTVDDFQSGLDVASAALDVSGPGASASWVPDAVNAGIYAARGKMGQAALSVAAMVPFVGAAVYLQRASSHVDEASTAGTTVYRSMRDAGGTPATGQSARALGVRPGTGPGTDIPVDAAGMVHPGTGGMSVAPSPGALPAHRRPAEFGGSGKDPVWGHSASDLGPNLTYVPDSATHGTIQPSRPMKFEEYEGALCATGSCWFKQ
ncbi:MAG: RHS repeat-associated core domain-containing protein [Myxococcales bacterium]